MLTYPSYPDHIDTYMHIYLHKYIHTYIHTYTHIYIHTYIQLTHLIQLFKQLFIFSLSAIEVAPGDLLISSNSLRNIEKKVSLVTNRTLINLKNTCLPAIHTWICQQESNILFAF
jgi:hypothetical protein